MLLTQRAKSHARRHAEEEAAFDALPSQIVKLVEQVVALQAQVAKHRDAFNALVSTLNTFSYQDYKIKSALKTELSSVYAQAYFSEVE